MKALCFLLATLSVVALVENGETEFQNKQVKCSQSKIEQRMILSKKRLSEHNGNNIL